MPSIYIATAENPIPSEARKGILILGKDDRYEEERYEQALGRLDPLTEISGIQARLINLGNRHQGPGSWLVSIDDYI